MQDNITIPAGESLIGQRGKRAEIRGGRAFLNPEGDHTIVQGQGKDVNVILAPIAPGGRASREPSSPKEQAS